MEEARPDIAHVVVDPALAAGCGRLGRDLGEDPGVFGAAFGGIQQIELAQPRVAVMAGGNASHLGGGARHRRGVKEGAGPIGIGPVERPLVGAVRVHRHEQTGVGMGRVGVFPALIENGAVSQHARAPVMFLVEAELADLAVTG